MNGTESFTKEKFSILRMDDIVAAEDPPRRIRVVANEVLVKMDELFSRMYEADVKCA